MSREFFKAPSGIPCIAPPYGELVAVDPDSGKIQWHVPLGEIELKGHTVAGLPNLGGPAVLPPPGSYSSAPRWTITFVHSTLPRAEWCGRANFPPALVLRR